MKIKIYKFGGASIQDAVSIKKLANLLKEIDYEQNIIIVVSAIGKTTNNLEKIVKLLFNKQDTTLQINHVINHHIEICNKLFKPKHYIFKKIKQHYNSIQQHIYSNYKFMYDQIVSYGEIISSIILSKYFNSINIENKWLDARKYIKTDKNYTNAKINWIKTENEIKKLNQNQLYITQGFIGSDDKNNTTTLGREGSDYSASIFSYCLNANKQIIWKDVPGVLNADPRYFNDVKLLKYIPYDKALKLSYYGASVIHPKTINPLKIKKIPLYVKSFLNPNKPGTLIYKGKNIEPHLPCFMVKKNQKLLNIKKINYSYISNSNINEIFNKICNNVIEINLIQNYSNKLFICIYDKFNYISELIKKLKKFFIIKVLNNISLYTVMNFNNKTNIEFFNKKNIISTQTNRNTYQWLTVEK